MASPDLEALTVNGALKLLGVSRDVSLVELKRAYHRAAFKWHPDKGGSDDDFCLVQRALKLLQEEGSCLKAKDSSKQKEGAQAIKRQCPDVAGSAKRAAKQLRIDKNPVIIAGMNSPFASFVNKVRLGSLQEVIAQAKGQKFRKPPGPSLLPDLFASLKRPEDEGATDILKKWREEAFAAARGMPYQAPIPEIPSVVSRSRNTRSRPRTASRVRSSAAPKSSGAVPKSSSAVFKSSNAAPKGSAAKAPTSGSFSSALEQHVKRESERAAYIAENNRNSVDHCPMLARHLRNEAAACKAAARSVPARDIEAVAARIREAPHADRRSLLEALSQATRVALEQHLVQKRAAAAMAAAASAAGSSCSTSTGMGGMDPSRCSGAGSSGHSGNFSST
jgi:hypothetical protein